MFDGKSEVDAKTYAPAFICLALVFANHSLFRLGSLSLLWAGALVAVIGTVALLSPTIRFKAPEISPLRPVNIVLGVVLLMPLIASLGFGWSREFPFHGDHAFHNRQVRFLAHWLLAPVGSDPFTFAAPSHLAGYFKCRGVLLAAIVVVAAISYRQRRLAALVFAVVAFVGWGVFEHSVLYRYPAGAYYLGIPFMAPAYAAGHIELIGRLTSVSAAVAWLFILRPWLVGKWPDLPILLTSLFLLWQKDSIYIFDSSYLEPWAVVFLLLAVEVVIVRGRDSAPLSCLLVGFAAAIKEPPILALPFVWLAGEPWRQDRLHRAKLLGCGLAAGFPFLLYLAARKSLSIDEMAYDRPWRPGFDQLLTYADQFLFRMSVSFSGTGRLLALLCLALIPISLLWQGSRSRTQIAIAVCGGLFIMLFFALDLEGGPWAAGEYRFFLCSVPFLLAGAIAFGHCCSGRVVAALAAIALALQLPDVMTAVDRSGGPTSHRNFVENYNTPVVIPIKSILTEARQRGLLPEDAKIVANEFASGGAPAMDEVTFGPPGELYCECTADSPYVLASFVRYTNLNAITRPKFGPYESLDSRWRKQLSGRPACLAKLTRSCSHVVTRVEDGETVAALGTR